MMKKTTTPMMKKFCLYSSSPYHFLTLIHFLLLMAPIGTSAYWLLISSDLINNEIDRNFIDQTRNSFGFSLHNTVFNSHSENQAETLSAIRQHYSVYGKIIRDSMPKLKTRDLRGFRNEHVLVALRSAWKNRLILQQIIPFAPKTKLVLDKETILNNLRNNLDRTTKMPPISSTEMTTVNCENVTATLEPSSNTTMVPTATEGQNSTITTVEPTTVIIDSENSTTQEMINSTTISTTIVEDVTETTPLPENSTVSSDSSTTDETTSAGPILEIIDFNSTFPPSSSSVTEEPLTTTPVSTALHTTQEEETTVQDNFVTTPVPEVSSTVTQEESLTSTVSSSETVQNCTDEPETVETTAETSTVSTTTSLPDTTTTLPIYAGVSVILEPEQYRAVIPALSSLFIRPLRPSWPIRLTRLMQPFYGGTPRRPLRDDKIVPQRYLARKTTTTTQASTTKTSGETNEDVNHRRRRQVDVNAGAMRVNRNQCGSDVQDAACDLMSQQNSGSVFFLPWTWNSLLTKTTDSSTDKTGEQQQSDWQNFAGKVSPLETIVSLCLGYKLQSPQCPEVSTLNKLSRISSTFFEKHNEPLYIASLTGERLCRFDGRRRKQQNFQISNTNSSLVSNDTVLSLTSDVFAGRGAVLLCGSIIYPSISTSIVSGYGGKTYRHNESCNEIGREAQLENDATNGGISAGNVNNNRTVSAVLATTYKCRSFSNAISAFHIV